MEIKTWKTNDGRVLKISDMGDSHIKNCIKLIERVEAEDPGEQFGSGSYHVETAIESENRHNEYMREELANTKIAFLKELKLR